MTEKIKPRDKPHYVNNRDFSYAVVDYVKAANDAKARPTLQDKCRRYSATA